MAHRRLATNALALSLLILSACGGRSGETPAPSREEYIASVQAWRDKHEASYRHEYVSIAGLHFLKPGTHTIGSAKTSGIVISPNVATLIAGLAILGAGQGIVYYAALYYAMSVGRAAVVVDQGWRCRLEFAEGAVLDFVGFGRQKLGPGHDRFLPGDTGW